MGAPRQGTGFTNFTFEDQTGGQIQSVQLLYKYAGQSSEDNELTVTQEGTKWTWSGTVHDGTTVNGVCAAIGQGTTPLCYLVMAWPQDGTNQRFETVTATLTELSASSMTVKWETTPQPVPPA